ASNAVRLPWMSDRIAVRIPLLSRGDDPVGGQAGLSVAYDSENRAAVFGGEILKREPADGRAGVLAGENIVEPLINPLAHRLRHAIEGSAIDHVRERIAEQPLLEIEVTQRTALLVAGAALRKRFRERGHTSHRFLQWVFVAEQHVGREF